MAPNLKHFSRLAAPLADLKVVRPKDADYQPRQPAVDSDSYWEWPAQSEPTELVSTDHIVANLIRDAASSTSSSGKSSQIASNDEYWAEEEVMDQAEAVSETRVSNPQHEAQLEVSADYWDEASYERTARDEYWNTAASPDTKLPYPTTTIRNRSVNPSQADVYWQEASHSATDDSYWRESRPAESADGDYWTWKAGDLTYSDRYWAWSVPAQ